MRSDESEDDRPIRGLLRRLIRAPAMLSFVWPAMLIIGGYMAWHRWGADYMNEKYYGVDPSQIQVSDPPSYVRSDIIKTVYNDTAMEGLSLLDNQATAKIASAFATHPWIRRVNSVRKLPGGVIDVRLDYRKPVAMVHVLSKHPKVKGDSFFAVDRDGVLLPQREFSQEETQQYVHISVPNAYPTGRLGGRFGDLRVESAASVAAVIAPFREQTGIAVIGVHGDPRQSSVPQLELATVTGKKKFWGSPPGMERPGEPTAVMKLKTLLASGDENINLQIATLPNEQTH